MKVRIATRESPLAVWQAEFVKSRLEATFSEAQVELVPMTTKGDQILNQTLSKIGGKGLFIKELELALLEDRADIAVHSMKDVPADMPDGFVIAAMLQREDPLDALVSNQYSTFDSLPQGAKVGTSSLRRQAQLLANRPDLKISPVRGNVQTRLRKLDEGNFDAILLASAGLKRLEMQDRIAERLDTNVCLPAIGQGVVGIECRETDHDMIKLVQGIQHQQSTEEVLAERAFGRTLGGDCQSPIAGFATISDDALYLRGLVASPDGQTVVASEITGSVKEAEALGQQLGKELLAKGAEQILRG